MRLFSKSDAQSNNRSSAIRDKIPARYSMAQWVPRIGDKFPDVCLDTTEGDFWLSAFGKDGWIVLVALRGAFSSVASTELIALERAQSTFAEQGARIIAFCCDPINRLQRWQSDLSKIADFDLTLPIIADPAATIAHACGLIHPRSDLQVPAPSTLIIDRELKIRSISSYSPEVGRDFNETLRILSALQRHGQDGALLPANWRPGKPTILPMTMTDAEAHSKIASGKIVTRNYLRMAFA